MHSLARDPGFRPDSAAAFAHELGATEQLRATAVTEALRSTRRYESIPGYGAWLWIAGAAVIAAVAVAAGLLGTGGGGDNEPKPPAVVQIAPPARGATPAAEARNLSAWLRRHSR